MIELAPHSKHGLSLSSPLIAGSGAVGFGDAWPPQVVPSLFGAFVTAPVSRGPRRGSSQPRLAELPGGFLLNSGEQNPGWRRVISGHAAEWRRLGVPVIVSLATEDVDNWRLVAERFEEGAAVAGLEVPIPGEMEPRAAGVALAAVRRAVTLPLLAKLPVAKAETMAPAASDAGVDALVVGSAPPALYPAAGGEWVEGIVGGLIALPFTLRALHAVVDLDLGLPLVAAGGIMSTADAELSFSLGAMAVQVRSLLWTDPAAFVAVAERLTPSRGS